MAQSEHSIQQIRIINMKPIGILEKATRIIFSCLRNLQLSKSSLAINGGAFFSAVSGWKSIPISVPGPYKCPEWYRLSTCFFHHQQLFFCPKQSQRPAAPWVFQIDLCRNRTHGFVCLTNQWGQIKHKSIWNAHRAEGSRWVCGAKEKLMVMKKTSSL